jgi:hypothetical protein
MGIEEDQMEEPGHIAATHLVGLLRVVRLHMSVDDHRHRDDTIRRRFGETCTGAAIHQPGRQVPAQGHHLVARQFLDEFPQPRPESGQRCDGRKQWKQDLRAHDKSLGQFGPADNRLCRPYMQAGSE